MFNQEEYIPVPIFNNDADQDGRRVEPLLPGKEEGAPALGRKYCCCFDMRRAVIIVNVIDFAIFFLFSMLCAVVLALVDLGVLVSDNTTPDAMTQIISFLKSVSLVAAHVAVLKIPLNGLGVYGASAFKCWPVVLCLSAHSLGFYLIFGVGKDYIFPMIMFTAFVAYPHLCFIYEVRTGVMSEMTYLRERSGIIPLCC